MPKITELGELDYRLVIYESVSNPDDTNAPTILTFYLIDRDVGCPKQSLTFVLEVTCPKKKLLFNYGKVEFIDFGRAFRRALFESVPKMTTLLMNSKQKFNI